MRRVNTSASPLEVEAASSDDISENHELSKDVHNKFDSEKPVERTFVIFEDAPNQDGRLAEEIGVDCVRENGVRIPQTTSSQPSEMSTSMCDPQEHNKSSAKAHIQTNAPGNIFAHLGVFFHEDCAATPEILHGSHNVEPADDYRILPGLLEDMLRRGLFSLSELVSQIKRYFGCSDAEGSSLSSDDPTTSLQLVSQKVHVSHPKMSIKILPRTPPCLEQQREFIVALYHAAHSPGRVGTHHDVDPDIDLAYNELIKLLWTTPGAFKRLFWSVLTVSYPCSTPISKKQRTRLEFGLALLDDFLVKAPMVLKDVTHPVDALLSFGETPLVVACRHVNHRVVLLLLRHGATMKTSWMRYRTALQVLLFSPNVVHLEDWDRKNLELCLEYFSRTFPSLNVPALEEIACEGYHPLHENWRHLVRECHPAGPPRLQHLSRCSVRQALRKSGQLPRGVKKLPLPSLVIDYVDLGH